MTVRVKHGGSCSKYYSFLIAESLYMPACNIFLWKEFDNFMPFWCTKCCTFLKMAQNLPSRQILVPRTSRGRPPPTSPGRPLKILFDRPGDVLIWRSRDVPGRLIRDVPRTFSGRPLEDLESTQTWMSNFFLTFLSELIRLTKSKSISTLKVYWEPSKTSKMEHFLQN